MVTKTVDETPELGKLLAEGGGDVFRALLARMLCMVMDSEVASLCGAERWERNDERVNQRNGYRERDLETRLGTVSLAIPKLRQGSYLPSFLEPRRLWETAFVAAVAEAYIVGVSTRRVEQLVEAMGAKGMSRSTVSRMVTEVDGTVKDFNERVLSLEYPYLWLDALYVKVREGGRVVSRAVLIAYAVSVEGHREVLGVEVAAGEMTQCWRQFLGQLLARGLRGVKLVISDAHEGLKGAVRACLVGVTWQRCTVHFARNVCALLPKSHQAVVGAALSTVFKQPDQAAAKIAIGKVLELLKKHPRAAAVVEAGEDDVLAFYAFPQAHWRQLHSTNPLERENREIRRRTDVVGIFPNDASVKRLVVSLLIDQNAAWAVGKRYLSLESMARLKGMDGNGPPPAALAEVVAG